MPSMSLTAADETCGASRPTVAVLFRTHFWNDYVQRQFDRLLERKGSGDVFVLIDITKSGTPSIPNCQVVTFTENDLVEAGFPREGHGSLLWFNGDYPLYHFLALHGSYDYYLQLEYDVVCNFELDDLINRAARDGADFVGLTKGEPIREWPFLPTCDGVYDPTEVRFKLICLSLFSNRALHRLADRRLELAQRRRRSEIPSWPYCEAFIATEMNRAGFHSPELSAYVDTSRYAFWPPFLERDLQAMPDHSVVHPVLDRDRYIQGLLKVKVGLLGYLNVNSVFHQKLRRLPAGVYVSTVVRTFAQKARREITSTLSRDKRSRGL